MAGQNLDKLLANINFHKYWNSIFVVGQREVCRCFLWLYHHHHGPNPPYVGQCLRATPRGMNRIGAIERAVFDRGDSPTKMDIPLLYRLLQHICNLAEDTQPTSIWNCPTTPEEQLSLEHTLYKIKEKRNKLSHKPMTYVHMTEEDLETYLDELCDLLCRVIREAGLRTGRTLRQINDTTDKIKDDCSHIRTMRPSFGISPQKFTVLAKQELEEQRRTIIDLVGTFVMPVIKRSVNTTGMAQAEDVSADQLLKWRCVDGKVPKVILMRGDTGAGKTYLCQQVQNFWLRNDTRITDLNEYDLVLLIVCRDVFTRDLVRLLQDELLPRTMSHCEGTEVMNILKSLKILWIIEGFEEASADGKDLLKRLFSITDSDHTVLVSTRPEHTVELTSIILPEERICEVTLYGFSEDGRDIVLKRLLQQDMSDTADHVEQYEQFKHDFKHLRRDIQVELNNPLKFILAVKLWKEGNLNTEAGAPLSHLYRAIQDVQLKNVVEKLRMKCSLTEAETRVRVETWLGAMYRVAFNMILDKKFIIIDKDNEKLLMDNFQCLLPSYTDCFSTFLSSMVGNSSLTDTYYQFIHSTQQCYFAAQHICSLMLQQNYDEKKFAELLKVDLTKKEQIDRFYEVLLYTASLVTREQLDRDATETLTKFLSQCQNCNWFDVIHYTGYSDTFIKEVCKYIPDNWGVTDTTVKAANILMQQTVPSIIIITLEEDPDNIVSLKCFLQQIAQHSIWVNIMFNYYNLLTPPHKTCDEYIKILCGPSAQCNIYELTGMLSADGCNFISQMSNLKTLTLSVQNQKTLEALLLPIYSNYAVEELILFMDTRDFEGRLSISLVRYVILDLYLPYVCDSDVEASVKLLPRLTHKYRKIGLSGLSADGALQFVQGLKSRGVSAEQLLRSIKFIHDGMPQQVLWLPYGPIPVRVSEMQFIDMWCNPKVELTINVDITPNETP
ncbi:uncharacterized protein LOC121864480 [Homarus americanus]|uniref:Putative NACHT domain and DZIP3/ hRUL138-like HEPN-containing protein 2 n=1 Tax=Homarus americanus TaxID=6706 RepID=A0A8J5K4I0_HOMAM|nr:uncharacterized protein LOC121864480 [Homarus americanus]KAG7170462.1 putative NACHT domain and DZIP3/ hRUL138-like HEPN-containing protein 2 [Homarus americanus]